jgi:DNA-binding protein HU-beta
MTKADVIKEINIRTDIEKNDVSTILESFFTIVKTKMEDGNEIFIRGFGSFIIKKRAPKLARNIKKNTPVMIDAHVIPQFRPAPEFIDKIRNSKEFKKS